MTHVPRSSWRKASNSVSKPFSTLKRPAYTKRSRSGAGPVAEASDSQRKAFGTCCRRSVDQPARSRTRIRKRLGLKKRRTPS